MAGWLESAARALGRGAPPPPVETPYEVVCGCGHIVTGMRRRTPQAPQCPCCGERVFVLPTSVYPQPQPRKAPAAKPPAPPVVTPEPLPVEEDVPTEPLEPAPPPVLAPQLERNRGRKRPPAPPPEKRLEIPRRRVFTKLRLLALAIVALLLLTGALAWRAHRRDQAELAIAARLDPLSTALGERSWADAEAILNELCRAATILGRDDPEARRWRRQQLEVVVLNRRAAASFFDLVREIEPAMLESDATWSAHFRLTYQGQWLIFDAPVYRTTDESGATRVLVDLPVSTGRRQVEIEAPLAAFEPLGLTSEPQAALFAAQLAECRLPGPGEPRLAIRLAPETGFLWCTPETLAGTGLEGEDDDERRSLEQKLARQARLIGLELPRPGVDPGRIESNSEDSSK